MKSVLVEISSLVVAIVGGIYMYWGMQDIYGFVLMYLFGIACGMAGSRCSSIVRRGI